MRKSPNVWYVGDRCLARSHHFPRYGKAPATIVQVHPYIRVQFDQRRHGDFAFGVELADLTNNSEAGRVP